MRKPIPIGTEFYKEMIDKGYYYVDKTLLIKTLLDSCPKVSLFTRPRRFGKTLALSMLKTFFEDERAEDGTRITNRQYFTDTKIANAGEKYMSVQGQYPVIFLTLKSAKQPDYEMAYRMLCDQIAGEFKRHSYILKADQLSVGERERFERTAGCRGDRADYASALKFLSECLKKYHGYNAIILIDEYDVPLENAYYEGFYDQMTAFVRSLFESALKTNDSLEFAIITGCLRISKESIFTGLNNLEVISILNHIYAEYFGFTQPEAEALLACYGLQEKMPELREWYDGYQFGDIEVYNPWSVLNYVKVAAEKYDAFPKPYWSNTSSNSIVHDLVERADLNVRQEIETLIAGGTVEKPVHEDITYGDIHESQDNLWNFLFFTGYLKKVGERKEEEAIYLSLKIPNAEVRYVYRNTILAWFDRKVRTADRTPLYQALHSGDCAAVEGILKKQLSESISFFDSAEQFYHGFMVGMLGGLGEYLLQSNRETGDGRADLVMVPTDEKNPVIIFELKKTDKFTLMDRGCEEALRQIEEKHYDQVQLDEGYEKFIKYGICFCKKTCKVKKAE